MEKRFHINIGYLGCALLLCALVISQTVSAATAPGLHDQFTAMVDCGKAHPESGLPASKMKCCDQSATLASPLPDNTCTQDCADACAASLYVIISPLNPSVMPEMIIEGSGKPASLKSIDLDFVTPPPRV